MAYRIKQYRELRGMTQADLADASGVSRVMISYLETGRSKNASSYTLLSLAKALGTTVDNLFFDDTV